MAQDGTPRPPLRRQGAARRRLWPVRLDLNREMHGPDADDLDRETARLWSLVLASRHVPHLLRQVTGGGWSVQIRAPYLRRAMEEIRLHREENYRTVERLPYHAPSVDSWEPTVTLMTLLTLFYMAYTRAYPAWGLYPERWVELGSVDARLLLAGQWWRAFTGLTLHADPGHILGNAVIGGVFGGLAARRLGSGVAWMLVLISGAAGNWLNSVASSPLHNSIGFSTAVFGAAGILAGVRPFAVGGGVHGAGSNEPWTVRLKRFTGSALIPAGAGLGLLSMLGAGADTDVGAHLFGFLAGLGLGALAGLGLTRLGLPSRRTDRVLLALVPLIVAGCWVLAWTAN